MGKNKEWFGFDLDGTLAEYRQGEWKGYKVIGKPIARICNVAKRLHADGKTVRILTARVSDASVSEGEASLADIKDVIWKWCDRNLGFRPEIVAEKDHHLNQFYDDRCLEVVRNDGILVRDAYKETISDIDSAIKSITSYLIAKDEAEIDSAMKVLRRSSMDGHRNIKRFSE